VSIVLLWLSPKFFFSFTFFLWYPRPRHKALVTAEARDAEIMRHVTSESSK
jgi:hypothetical protein